MTFGLIGWLKSRYPGLNYEVPMWYPSREKTDSREWLVTNGLGGYSMGTISGANRRRYHSLLVSAMPPPVNRRVILSRVEEVLSINNREYELSTNYWESGVVSPTGYKFIESFTTLPVPTWVFEVDGNYLVKQIARPWGKDEVQIGYFWLPDPDSNIENVRLTCKFLIGYRDHHLELKGSSEKTYAQFVSPNQSMIMLDDAHKLCLAWSEGVYESQKQWWWDYKWPTESARGLPSSEDLYLVGCVTANLHEEFSIAASLENAISKPNCTGTVDELIKRQQSLIDRAKLDGSQRASMMLLAADQFIVSEGPGKPESAESGNSDWSDGRKSDAENSGSLYAKGVCVIEGYPWYNPTARAAMISLPGLTLATRRFDVARRILSNYAGRVRDGIVPNRSQNFNYPGGSPTFEYEGADITLWWGWALYHFWKSARDEDFVKEQLPLLIDAALHYLNGDSPGISVDADGLLRCADREKEFSWMDTKVEGIPITPRPGKAVELCALWFNLLETIAMLAEKLGVTHESLPMLKEVAARARVSMQKFWNDERGCLHDVIEYGVTDLLGTGDRNCEEEAWNERSGRRESGWHEAGSHTVRGGDAVAVHQPLKNDDSVRCNQLLAVSLPFRALSPEQEKSILRVVEGELLISMGIRTLSSADPSYQGVFGCGFPHPDQYHRDLCKHQGTSWPWLFGQYCDALLNVWGSNPETLARIRLLLQPLWDHFVEEDCLGSMSEMFDGDRPHIPRGCPVYSLSVAEAMRWMRWVEKQ